MQNLKSNIWKLYCVHGIRFFLITMPVMAIYFHHYFGLSYLQIFLTQAVFSLFLLLGALPGGYFCDKVGRKTGMILGAGLWVMGNAFMLFWHQFSGFITAEVFWGISHALFSGAQPALLFDTLKQLKNEGAYLHYEGRVEFYGRCSEAVAALLGGFAAMISIMAPFWVSLIVSLSLFFMVLTLVEVKSDSEAKAPFLARYKTDIKTIVDCVFVKQKAVGWLLIFSGTIGLATLSSIWLYQPYFYDLHVNLGWFGVGWALINLCAACTARYADWLEATFGLNLLLSIILCGVVMSSFFLASTYSIWFFVLVLFTQALRGLKLPLVFNFVNQRVPSEFRATALSFDAFFMRILFVIFCPLIGYIADKNNILSAFLVIAIVAFVSGLMSLGMFFYRSKNMQAVEKN